METLPKRGVVRQAHEKAAELGRIIGVEGMTVDSLGDRFGKGAASRREHGDAARERLAQREAEGLRDKGRDDHAIDAAQKAREIRGLVGPVQTEADAGDGSRLLTQALRVKRVGSRPQHDQIATGRAGDPERLEDDVGSLVGHQGSDKGRPQPAIARMVAGGSLAGDEHAGLEEAEPGLVGTLGPEKIMDVLRRRDDTIGQ